MVDLSLIDQNRVMF